MAAGSTYSQIATTTLGSAGTATFSNIPQTYTNLVIVMQGAPVSSGPSIGMQFNGDTGTNYSFTYMFGNGSTASSGRGTSRTYGVLFDFVVGMPTTSLSTAIASIPQYQNTSTYKSYIARGSNANTGTDSNVGLWRSTAAITSLSIITTSGSNYQTGAIFSLYGIRGA